MVLLSSVVELVPFTLIESPVLDQSPLCLIAHMVQTLQETHTVKMQECSVSQVRKIHELCHCVLPQATFTGAANGVHIQTSSEDLVFLQMANTFL